MAKQYLKKTTLRVEGIDDLYAVADLLKLHRFDMDGKPRDVEIHKAEGRTKLLDSIRTAVLASTGTAVGFIVDADQSATSTWESMRDRLAAAIGETIEFPKTCPPNGFVMDIDDLKSRVGVWIWPDNSRNGILEDFLQSLVRVGDPILPISERATGEAVAAGARFPRVARSKAVIHAWLAWQEEPGNPFGVGLKARYFDHQSAGARAFVDWVIRMVD